MIALKTEDRNDLAKRIEATERDLDRALEFESQGYRPPRSSGELRAELEQLVAEQEAVQ
jgi:hypothetical protein